MCCMRLMGCCLFLAGDQAQHYVLDFDEKSGPDPLGDMLMKVNRQAVPCA